MKEALWRMFAWTVSRRPVARWLIRRAKRTPYTPLTTRAGDQVYMERWWLLNPYDPVTRAEKHPWLPFSVRIHHILLPDEAPDLHDHPWDARTVILMGDYVEEREGGEYYTRMPGDTAALRFNEFHRIMDVAPMGAVTLFITFRYRGTWGFLVGDRKVPWREYLGLDA